MDITRKEFCAGLAGGSVLLLLQSCGGGGSSYGGGGGTPAACGASGTAIAGNHGHVLTIPRADLVSPTAPQTYHFTGTADHIHDVTLSVADLQNLYLGMSVVATSTTATGVASGIVHSHVVTSTCPP